MAKPIPIGKKHIGSGGTREVYVHPDDDTKVVKVCSADCEDNREEYNFWKRASEPMRLWLAPVYSLSRDGTRLVMGRTTRLPRAFLNRFFREVPDVFGDIHQYNWGLYGNRVVCHDYAINCKGWTRADPRLKQRADW